MALTAGNNPPTAPVRSSVSDAVVRIAGSAKEVGEEHVREQARNSNRAWKPNANTDESDLYGLFKHQLSIPVRWEPSAIRTPISLVRRITE